MNLCVGKCTQDHRIQEMGIKALRLQQITKYMEQFLSKILLSGLPSTYFVQMFQGEDNFTNVHSDFILPEPFPLVQMCEQLTTTHVI